MIDAKIGDIVVLDVDNHSSQLECQYPCGDNSFYKTWFKSAALMIKPLES